MSVGGRGGGGKRNVNLKLHFKLECHHDASDAVPLPLAVPAQL